MSAEEVTRDRLHVSDTPITPLLPAHIVKMSIALSLTTGTGYYTLSNTPTSPSNSHDYMMEDIQYNS